ncbi:MAG: GntR family transcriptional regulator [Propionibacteriaceae bacterium]|nr:GntR family transcriptional regulator [Propionibacteriaceae bacterium]
MTVVDPLGEIRLGKSSPVPLYCQVATQLEALIRTGKLPVGTWLDNEIGLAQRLGLSRPTMRRAIAELVAEGLLVRRRGVGTRVVSNDIIRPIKLTSLYDDLLAGGSAPTTQVLVLREVAPTPQLAEEFASGGRLVEMLRLRGTASGPLALLRNWIPVTVPGVTRQALEAGGLYGLLRASGADLRIARAVIGARGADKEESRLLGLAVGAACLTVRRAVYDGAKNLIEVGDHLCRGDRYHFTSAVMAR